MLLERLTARLAAVESEQAALRARFDAVRQAWAGLERRVGLLEDGQSAALQGTLDGLVTREEVDALTDTVRALVLHVEALEQRPSPRGMTFEPSNADRS